MKPIFKNSAIAILVALGVSGCLSTGSSDTANKNDTTTVNPTTPTQSNQPVVAAKTDKNGDEWRHIRLAGGLYFDKPQGKNKTTTYQEGTYDISWAGADSTSDNYYLDLSANNFKQGKNEGTLSNDIKMKLVGPDGTDWDSYGKLNNPIKYVIVNQPYSSYGVLFSADSSIAKQFYLGQNAGVSNSQTEEYQVGTANGKSITWNDSVVGDATYKGKVIASVNGAAPIEDGDITIKAHFVNGAYNQSTVSITVNSQTLGQFDLGNSHISTIQGFDGSFGTRFSDRVTTAKGDFNDVVGKIYMHNYNTGTNQPLSYEAVFGGTKQK